MNLVCLIERFFRAIDVLLNGEPRKSKLNLSVTICGATFRGEKLLMDLKDTQKVPLAISPKDKAGNPAKVDGVPVWTSSDTSVVTVEAAPDGLTAFAVSQGLGTAKVSVSADADLGEGVTTLTESTDITVIGDQASSLNLKDGDPIDK